MKHLFETQLPGYASTLRIQQDEEGNIEAIAPVLIYDKEEDIRDFDYVNAWDDLTFEQQMQVQAEVNEHHQDQSASDLDEYYSNLSYYL